MNPLRLSLAAGLLAALLAGCTAPVYREPSTAATPAQQQQMQIDDLLNEANQAAPIRSAELRLQAAQQLIAQNQRDKAMQILGQIDTAHLPPILRFNIAKLKAGTALEQRDSHQALMYLAEMPSTEPLPTAQAIELGQLKAQAYAQQQDSVGELRELIHVAQLQQDPDKRQALHEQIWSLLTALPAETLQSLVSDGSGTYYEQGWYELANSLRTSTDLAEQYQKLNEWKQLWQSHPALKQPPKAVAALFQQNVLPVRRIGLLLPQSGPLARAAGAISDGFMAAYYAAQRDGRPVPELQILDSTLVSTPQQLFSMIEAQQLDLVIGPLDKDFVAAIGQSPSVPVPILALNNTDGAVPDNFFQFGLAAEDDAQAAARRAWQDGRRRMLVMTPNTDWGARVSQAFIQTFRQLGGEIVGSMAFNDKEELSNQVSQLLETDLSQARAQRVRQIIGTRVQFQEQPRTDADALFLSALPTDARQIKPLLAFNYAGGLPVYATSHIYSGTPNSISDVDLNGVEFCDLPWVLGPPSTLKLSMSQERNDVDTRFGRLYALGADAFTLYPYLEQLKASPMARISGETGQLYLEGGSRIARDLTWAKFENGVPKLLDAPQDTADSTGADAGSPD